MLSTILEPLRPPRRERIHYSSVNLTGANLSGAILTGADLRGVDLSGAIGLTADQFREALIDDSTRLPDDLR